MQSAWRNIQLRLSRGLRCRCNLTRVGRPDATNHADFGAFNRCKAVTDTGAFDIGTGPSVRDWHRSFGADLGATRRNGGMLDHAERTLYVGARWKDSQCPNGNPECTFYGAVLAVDINWGSPVVGNRRLVSGYTLAGTRGKNPILNASSRHRARS